MFWQRRIWRENRNLGAADIWQQKHRKAAARTLLRPKSGLENIGGAAASAAVACCCRPQARAFDLAVGPMLSPPSPGLGTTREFCNSPRRLRLVARENLLDLYNPPCKKSRRICPSLSTPPARRGEQKSAEAGAVRALREQTGVAH